MPEACWVHPGRCPVALFCCSVYFLKFFKKLQLMYCLFSVFCVFRFFILFYHIYAFRLFVVLSLNNNFNNCLDVTCNRMNGSEPMIQLQCDRYPVLLLALYFCSLETVKSFFSALYLSIYLICTLIHSSKFTEHRCYSVIKSHCFFQLSTSKICYS